MSVVPSGIPRSMCLLVLLLLVSARFSYPATTWNGVLRDAEGKPVAGATITLLAEGSDRKYEATTAADGTFSVANVEAGSYTLTAETAANTWTAAEAIESEGDNVVPGKLTLSGQDQTLLVNPPGPAAANTGSGGQHLSSQEVA